VGEPAEHSPNEHFKLITTGGNYRYAGIIYGALDTEGTDGIKVTEGHWTQGTKATEGTEYIENA
jgi:hypothetical protein